ncbi:hypothetical protein GGS24DRAFT_506653 [Hypoxylon argillaceum]|nr:hypothetical protein GGS24DRAFT_506653 [Hypoxylon argillaceum]
MATTSLFRCRLADDTIIIDLAPHAAQEYRPRSLRISFQRTIRVPDNKASADLPPGLGNFPLFKLRDFAARLPAALATKSGLFFPMYQREAMWINIGAQYPFMVKVYAGGVNVVSGEHSMETEETKRRRRELVAEGKSVQDYVVAPPQRWLDGFAVGPGVVRQFVAMPLGAGYSVEAQLTGQEQVGGLQLEITPSRPTRRIIRRFGPPGTFSGSFTVRVRALTGAIVEVECSPLDTVDSLKWTFCDWSGVPADQQRFIFSNIEMEDGRTLSDYNVTSGSTICMVMRLRGGGFNAPVGVAAGGKIKQTILKDGNHPDIWATASTITIPVHILNTALFRDVTGQRAPPCPISASTYARVGLPFFDFPETPSGIAGDFENVKSVRALDVERGLASGEEPSVRPRVVTIARDAQSSVDLATIEDPHGLVSADGPLRAFRTLTMLCDETSEGTMAD